MEYTKKIVYQSNYWYNDGLRKAKIRDMSGAIMSLRKSLQFNRENIAARNLLGSRVLWDRRSAGSSCGMDHQQEFKVPGQHCGLLH